jgi:hypothetical protein
MDGSVTLTRFDDRRPPYGPFNVHQCFEVLPGDHQVRVSFTPRVYDRNYSEAIPLEFSAEAGRTYRIDYEVQDLYGGYYYSGGTWEAWIIDEATGEKLKEKP